MVGVDPRPGYLHRGIEKWMESRTYHQIIPMTDRLDYISCMCNNLGYVVAVERLAGINVPERAQVLRTLTAELTRISSHLIWLGTSAVDIGAMTVLLYAAREREFILDLLEMATGARLTVSYARIGGVRNDVPATSLINAASSPSCSPNGSKSMTRSSGKTASGSSAP